MEIEIVNGSIMDSDCECIVNPANKSLAHGGGLCGIIYDAIQDLGESQYKEFIDEIRKLPLIKKGVRCDVGEAVITSAGGLKFKAIIHTVGPFGSDPSDFITQKLKECYENCLNTADSCGIKSIAVPLISGGIYACPKPQIVKCFMDVVKDFKPKNLHVVKMYIPDKKDMELFPIS